MEAEETNFSDDLLTLNQIKEWIEICRTEQVDELEIEKGNWLLRIRTRYPYPILRTQGLLSATPELAHQQEELPSDPLPAPDIHISAPLTGIFYSRPRPDAPPFVRVGSPVSEGQVVALVESMKVFNEVKSEVSGVVRQILPKDGQLVQHGETIIVLQRSGRGG